MIIKIFNKRKNILSGFLSLVILLTVLSSNIYGDKPTKKIENEELLEIAEGIIEWKKRDLSSDLNAYLLNDRFLENAGDTSGDWFPLGIGRLGYEDDYQAYLAVISDKVKNRYLNDEKLSISKATEWHRISLAVLAMGGDPRDLGIDKDNKRIELIGDGTFNRGRDASLGAQGINGWIWGLIALDSMRYTIPEDSFYKRDDIILEILKLQLEDGGFSLDGNESDADITAMVIQSFSPYYNSEQKYSYFQDSIDKDVNKRVRDGVDEALDYLSKAQLANGGFYSWNIENSESVAQVLVALTSLGIDPQEDERFIKDGNTLLDSLLSYRKDDGGFIHSRVYDPENPTAEPNISNSMASEQVLYSLASLIRLNNNYRNLYDFREEMSKETKEMVDSVKQDIDKLETNKDKAYIKKVFSKYMEIPLSERNYVYNYKHLSDLMKTLDIENNSEFLSENIGLKSSGKGTIISVFDGSKPIEVDNEFSESDFEKLNRLPEDLTTKNYVEVLKMIRKIEMSEDKENFSNELDSLYIMKKDIKTIQDEIDLLNDDILDKLYPFSAISIKDRKNVNEIADRFNNLSDYDKTKVLEHEDILKTKTHIDSLVRAVTISLIIFLIIVLLIVIVGRRIKKRRIEKMKDKMLFFDDEEV